jgi:hypothetical protein
MTIKRTKRFFVPFALCAIGSAVLCFTGCSREGEAKKPARHESANYMNDPGFRKSLDDARRELAAIAAKRKPLADRMQKLIHEHGEDLAKLQKIAEWNDLHRKVTELNEKYESARRRMLAFVRERITPAKEAVTGKAGK